MGAESGLPGKKFNAFVDRLGVAVGADPRPPPYSRCARTPQIRGVHADRFQFMEAVLGPVNMQKKKKEKTRSKKETPTHQLCAELYV